MCDIQQLKPQRMLLPIADTGRASAQNLGHHGIGVTPQQKSNVRQARLQSLHIGLGETAVIMNTEPQRLLRITQHRAKTGDTHLHMRMAEQGVNGDRSAHGVTMVVGPTNLRRPSVTLWPNICMEKSGARLRSASPI